VLAPFVRLKLTNENKKYKNTLKILL